MIGSTCKAASTARARARRRPAPCRPRRRRAAPRRRTSRWAGTATAEGHRSRRRSAAARVRGRSTSAPTAWCSRTTRGTWPPWWTSTSRAPSPSTSPKRACRWGRATCPRRSSTRRRRPACAHPASSFTSTTPGTSTIPATVRRRTPTRTRTRTRRTGTRRRRQSTTWRRRATPACCCRARRWRSTRARTPRTSTPRPTPTLLYQVWKRRCKTRPRICTGSESRPEAAPGPGRRCRPPRAARPVRPGRLAVRVSVTVLCGLTGTDRSTYS